MDDTMFINTILPAVAAELLLVLLCGMCGGTSKTLHVYRRAKTAELLQPAAPFRCVYQAVHLMDKICIVIIVKPVMPHLFK